MRPVRPTIAELVRENMIQLTASERKVARALLASYPLAGLEPLRELSGRALVSMPTVVRFVIRLGFEGYPAFQQSLRAEVQERISSPSNRFDPQLSSLAPAGLIASSFGHLTKSLEATADGLGSHEFEAAVGLLSDSKRRISALGGRVSHVLATHLVNQLKDLRGDVKVQPGGSTRLMAELFGITKRDVLVVFDYKRYQRDTVTFAQQAARRGASLILITDPLLSPIADVAEQMLTFSVQALPPFDSPIGGFAIVETLLAGVAARLGEAGRARISQMEELSTPWMWDQSLVKEGGRDV